MPNQKWAGITPWWTSPEVVLTCEGSRLPMKPIPKFKIGDCVRLVGEVKSPSAHNFRVVSVKWSCYSKLYIYTIKASYIVRVFYRCHSSGVYIEADLCLAQPVASGVECKESEYCKADL